MTDKAGSGWEDRREARWDVDALEKSYKQFLSDEAAPVTPPAAEAPTDDYDSADLLGEIEYNARALVPAVRQLERDHPGIAGDLRDLAGYLAKLPARPAADAGTLPTRDELWKSIMDAGHLISWELLRSQVDALYAALANASRRSEFHHQNHLAAERELDAARADSERLDWLERQAYEDHSDRIPSIGTVVIDGTWQQPHIGIEVGDEKYIRIRQNKLRDAIDAGVVRERKLLSEQGSSSGENNGL